MNTKRNIDIASQDYWFKIVDFLQQNWALVQEKPNIGYKVFFINDDSGVFDWMDFNSESEAKEGLRRNGFNRFEEDVESQKFLTPPQPPFKETKHSNGPIYSSGRFWK